MRPVNKGANDKTYSDYPKARGDLIDRLGQYCSYCEMRLPASLAVEHVQPKTHHPELRRDWDNFLLACANCNSTKGSKNLDLKEYLWPDTDNTFLALVYSEGGRITVNSKLKKALKQRAQNILDLTGLQKNPSKTKERSDRRWINREEAWGIASDTLNDLKKSDTKELRKAIENMAYYCGHWSIWMTVFKSDRDMRNRLIEKFKGTCKECFDRKGQPIPKKGIDEF